MVANYSFNAIEAVLTYAIDRSYGEEYHTTLLNEMGLNEKTFYDQMYLGRPKEIDIKKALTLTYQPTLVYGFPGTGKTSVVRKVLFEIALETKPEPCFFPFDFKGQEQISSYQKDFDIKRWHREKLRTKINRYLYDHNIDDFEILFFFFDEKNKGYELSYEFDKIRRSLYNDYRNSTEESNFCSWFKSKIENRKTEFIELANQMISHFRNRDYLYFITNREPNMLTHCIIFYDNLDSITSNEVRKDFYKHIREYSGVISNYVHIIVTSRTSSIADQSMSDYGAYFWQKIAIDYQEFIDQKLFDQRVNSYVNRKGFCSSADRLSIRANLERVAKETFAKNVIHRRTSFLESIIQKKSLADKIDQSSLEKIKDIYELIIHNHHLHGALLELSNHDRHWMFRHMVTFIRYILEDLMLSDTSLGDNNEERSFILESYFYHWTINNKKIECTIYDIVKDTEEWHRAQIGLGCSFSHLIIAVIYNLTDRERGKHTYTSSTTIREVIEKLSELGYAPDQIISKIYDLYKSEDRYLGLIETSRYFTVERKSDLSYDDGIWLTPKAAYICEYLSLKFLFMIALYRHNKITDWRNSRFDYDDNDPVSINNIATNLNFLCKIASMHYEALVRIKSCFKDNSGWFQYYKRWFCIKAYDGPMNDNLGDLQLNNILRSHLLFLEHQRTITSYEYISPSIIDQYRRLQSTFNKAIDDLIDGKSVDHRAVVKSLLSCVNFKKFLQQ